ncbi:hypothetical protein BKA82DRAFT_532135 [Pisolithus tinctorius]|uniref:Histone deacetylase 8 n=1 Tax=Pisolithus tinctorius Marx 270 TaxID=870435 RepID=A0A0C3J7J6_PISTI|nr:hypothetical protein BKA82DRAFT_532135 [Pisolithus tinctorius]KIO05023.1 hypothetical protein M404DRAFT_532135 [Pisolithus tinctorius Marx 270]
MQSIDDSEVPARPASRVVYVVSEELVKASSLLPSNRNRSFLVHSLVAALDLFKAVNPDLDGQKYMQVIRPRRASPRELLVYHTRDYLEYALGPAARDSQDQSQISEFGLEDDCPPFHNMHEYIQLVAGATLTAVDALKDGVCDVAICWDGGRHHAQKSKASGFCYVADCVLAILALKKNRPAAKITSTSNTLPTITTRKPRVMYVDLDVHFSDAVSQAFYNASSTASSQILTLSIHHTSPGFFPPSLLSDLSNPDDPAFDPFTLSLPLKAGASNRTFARIWPIVDGVEKTFDPDFIVIQCGVDGLAGDPVATWNWCLGDGEGSLGSWLEKMLREWRGKKLLLGGGGYNSANAARAWAYLTSIAMGNRLPVDTDILEHRALPLYQPSFTLDVPAGNMRDENSEEYLLEVERRFERIREVLSCRLSGATGSA